MSLPQEPGDPLLLHLLVQDGLADIFRDVALILFRGKVRHVDDEAGEAEGVVHPTSIPHLSTRLGCVALPHKGGDQ